MSDYNNILQKLEGLLGRFDEVSTLITDPSVIADQKRYVRLTKEYKELERIISARKKYVQTLGNIEEAKEILANEQDAELRKMANEELEKSQQSLPEIEEEIKLLLIPADPEDGKNAIVEIRAEPFSFTSFGLASIDATI